MDFGDFAKAVNATARAVSGSLGGEVVPLPDELEGAAAVIFPVNFLANTRVAAAVGLVLAGAAGPGLFETGGAASGSVASTVGRSVAKAAEDAAVKAVLAGRKERER